MSIILPILIFLICLLGYTTYNLMRKVERQEDLLKQHQDYMISLDSVIKSSSKKLNEVDKKGMFSSDDEIGWYFENIKSIQELLDDYKLKL